MLAGWLMNNSWRIVSLHFTTKQLRRHSPAPHPSPRLIGITIANEIRGEQRRVLL
jgi:hypothetical protein